MSTTKAKSNTSHTGTRNGDLFCFNCGTAQKLHFPMPVNLATEFMKAFEKVHKNCKKTWTEPINSAGETRTESENAWWWLQNGAQGVSSKTMFRHLAKDNYMEPGRESHPLDPDDFNRCEKLLEAVPQLREKLEIMKSVSPVWSALVDNWPKLVEMLHQQRTTCKENGMYAFMKSLGC